MPTSLDAQLPRVSGAETLEVLSNVLLPLVARGLIVRRPPVVRAAERLELDRRAVTTLLRIRHRHGPGPVMIDLPGRRLALVLTPEDMHRVLDESPFPFTPASLEKRHALTRFQPAGVLVSEGPDRASRRRFNERVLDSDQPVHRDAEQLRLPVRDAAERILARADTDGGSSWGPFIEEWYAAARELILGPEARDDHLLTDLLGRLRAQANWAMFLPRHRATRARFLRRLERYVERPHPRALTRAIAAAPMDERTAPVEQIPQWLFAFDPAGMAAFRALALLATDPARADVVRQEARRGRAAGSGPGPPEWGLRPMTRATVLESLRLWPTTPAILRDSVVPTRWRGRTLPAGTGLLVYAPLFHRDPRLPVADRFTPDLWLDDDADRRPFVPFSAGPAVCPGQQLVLFSVSELLGSLLHGRRLEVLPPDRVDPRALPSVLNPFDLRFRFLPLRS